MAGDMKAKKTPVEAMVWLMQNSAEEIRYHKKAMWRDAAGFGVLSLFLVNHDKMVVLRDADWYHYYVLLAILGAILLMHRAMKILGFRGRLERVYRRWGVNFHKARDPQYRSAKADKVVHMSFGDWLFVMGGFLFYLLTATYVTHAM